MAYRLESGGWGPGAVRTHLVLWVGNFLGGFRTSFGEATAKCCGVVVAMPLGQSRAPPSSSESTVNTGTSLVFALCLRVQRGRGAGRTVSRSGWGGAEPS
jgi:hypothetical protein